MNIKWNASTNKTRELLNGSYMWNNLVVRCWYKIICKRTFSLKRDSSLNPLLPWFISLSHSVDPVRIMLMLQQCPPPVYVPMSTLIQAGATHQGPQTWSSAAQTCSLVSSDVWRRYLVLAANVSSQQTQGSTFTQLSTLPRVIPFTGSHWHRPTHVALSCPPVKNTLQPLNTTLNTFR